MEGQTDQKLIAHGRDNEITLTPTHLYHRQDLAKAELNSDENRIYQAINNAQFFYNQSPAESMADKTQQRLRTQVERTMMTEDAIHGNVNMKYRCPFPYIAYLCSLTGDRPDNFDPDKPEDKPLFEDYDGTNFIWTQQKDVSRALEKHRLLATTNVHGQYHPRFISPESSMGSMHGGSWQQLEADLKRLPSNLIQDCFTDDTATRIRARIDQAAGYGHEILKPYEAPEELAVIGVICGTHFSNTTDLNKHCDIMHGAPIARFQRAVSVVESSGSGPTPTSYPAPMQFGYGSSRRTIAQWVESKGFPQVLASDSVQDALNKWRHCTNTLISEMGAINDQTGDINMIYWGDIIQLFVKFLEKKTKAYDRLGTASLILGGEPAIFTPTTDYPVTMDKLRIWLTSALTEAEDYTLPRRFSQFMMDKIPMSQDIVEHYNLCYKNVEQHLGKSVKVVLPVQLGADQPFQPALVDVNS